MKLSERRVSRRAILAGGTATAAALAGRAVLGTPAAAQATTPAITSAYVSQAPREPDDPVWDRLTPASVAMNPQNLVVPRLMEAGAKTLTVRALHDVERLAFLLEWRDTKQDTELGTVRQFRDAVAIEIPEDVAAPTPSFTMGGLGTPVTIYHWKSDWQFGREHDVDEAHPNMYADWYAYSGLEAGKTPEASDYLTKGRKEYLTAAAAGNTLANPLSQEQIGPVQKMRAQGFGTIEPHPTQDARGKGVWRDGTWRVLISLPRKQEKFSIQDGAVVPVAFAAWDGARNERNGQKAYSLWQNLQVAAPAPGVTPTPTPRPTPTPLPNPAPSGAAKTMGGIGAAALVAAMGWTALVAYRIRRMGRRGDRGDE